MLGFLMNLESELFTLQDSNAKLVAALHEANANVEQWKKQLVAYQEETERLRDQVKIYATFKLCAMWQVQENQHDMLKDELTQSLEELENLLKAKDGHRIHVSASLNVFQELEMRNVELERRVQNTEQNLASALQDRERAENEVQRVIQILDVKIFDLNDLRQSLVKLISK
uniref:Homer protein homolog 3-like n=1 Tax=Sinocyclocheilus rhinocerous TaxID=307959 RepID=A0A673GVR9_9TELE